MGYRKKGVKKLAEKIGFTNVEIYYSQDEGWWIESDQVDNWIGMDSGIIEKQLKEIYQKTDHHNPVIQKFTLKP